eukprot:GHVU01132991.1.p3 GENE.GHVU01132991.1~~GHVU01132991.1.p3  ORF type:complete len:108 (+),score=19.90 GHVU01132991.1:568-891(+)
MDYDDRCFTKKLMTSPPLSASGGDQAESAGSPAVTSVTSEAPRVSPRHDGKNAERESSISPCTEENEEEADTKSSANPEPRGVSALGSLIEYDDDDDDAACIGYVKG